MRRIELENGCYKQIYQDGTIRYFNSKNQLHRENNEPAMIRENGDKFYYINSNKHRTNGPADEYVSGVVNYWLNHKEYSKDSYWKIINNLTKTEQEAQKVQESTSIVMFPLQSANSEVVKEFIKNNPYKTIKFY